MSESLLQKMTKKYPMIPVDQIDAHISDVNMCIRMSTDGRIENFNQRLEDGVDFRLETIKNGL